MSPRRVFASICLALALAACGSGGASPAPAGDSTDSGAVAAAPSALPPTDIPAPTATAKPTRTPSPTRTPAPTKTPRPTRTPAPPTEVPTATPEPEPITINGSGQTVTDPIYVPFSLARVTFTHNGRSNFIVQVYSGDDVDYLTNAIGDYTGSRLMLGEREVFFEMNADGDWTIQIDPLGVDVTLAEGASGRGDMITELFFPKKEGAVPYKFTHNGDSNFIVKLICAGGEDYVQNEIGTVDGSAVARFKDGPCMWDVQADGDWTIAPK
jgi:hypothetical protein